MPDLTELYRRSPAFRRPDQLHRHDGLNGVYAVLSVIKRLYGLAEAHGIDNLAIDIIKQLSWPEVYWKGLTHEAVEGLMRYAIDYASTRWEPRPWHLVCEKMPNLFEDVPEDRRDIDVFWSQFTFLQRTKAPLATGPLVDTVVLMCAQVPYDWWIGLYMVSTLRTGNTIALDPYTHLTSRARHRYTLDPHAKNKDKILLNPGSLLKVSKRLNTDA